MKVKLLVGRAGEDFAQAPGEIVDLSPDEAQRYVESGQAELIDGKRGATSAKKPSQRAEKRGAGSAQG